MYCEYCGKKLQEGAGICGACGLWQSDPRLLPTDNQSNGNGNKRRKKFPPGLIGLLSLLLIMNIGIWGYAAWPNINALVAEMKTPVAAEEPTDNPTDNPSTEIPTVNPDAARIEEVALSFSLYYLSFIDAVNAQKGSLVDYCSATLKTETAKRATNSANKASKFTCTEILVDQESFNFIETTNGTRVTFFAVCYSDEHARSSGAYKGVTTAYRLMEAIYDEDRQMWIMDKASYQKTLPMSNDLLRIYNQ